MGTNGVRTDCPGLAVALLSWEKEEEDDALPVVLLLTLGVRRENARGQDPVRHLSNLPSGPGLCGFGLGLGWTRAVPTVKSRGSNPQPKASCVAQSQNSMGWGLGVGVGNRRGLGREWHKRWWGRGIEQGLEMARPMSRCKPWGYSRSASWVKSKQRKLRHPHTHPHPLNPHTDSPRPLQD